MPTQAVWVFNGDNGRFPAAIFAERDLAEQWIIKHALSGVLTKYPINLSIHEWAMSEGFFRPTKPEHYSPSFIQRFSSASQEHYHYEEGINVSIG